MALDSRANLKVTVKNWLIRPADTLVDSFLDDWVTLAETRFNREQFLRSMITVVTHTISPSSGTPGRFALPTDFKQLRAMTILTPSPQEEIAHVLPEIFETFMLDTQVPGRPEFCAVIAEEFNVWPRPEQDYSLLITYWKKIPALSDTVTTNWLLTNAPDVYLFGTLIEACAHLDDETQLVKWESRYQSAIAKLVEADMRSVRSSGTARQTFSDLPLSRGRYDINTDN